MLVRQVQREEEQVKRQKENDKWERALKMAESTNPAVRKVGEELIAELTANSS